MRLYKCDVCGKIMMISSGERTVDRIFGLDLCRKCANTALDIALLDIALLDECIRKILDAGERGQVNE